MQIEITYTESRTMRNTIEVIEADLNDWYARTYLGQDGLHPGQSIPGAHETDVLFEYLQEMGLVDEYAEEIDNGPFDLVNLTVTA